MILQDHREIKTKSDRIENNEMPSIEDCNDRDVEYLVESES
jgi:hypothetical protein